jgi:[ribosomal protein S18]-alanine N-acetyltransferase
MRTALRYLVRPMRMEDIPQVLEVEHESFPTMWPPTAFKRELQQNRLARYIVLVERNPEVGGEPSAPEQRPGTIGRLFGGLRLRLGGVEEMQLPPPEQRPELVLGFAGLWMLPDEAHIVTIAVRESHRRRGLGELLLIRAIEMARESGQSLVALEVRVSNEPALRLYDKYGFHQSGLRPRYYSDNHEDAFILTLGSVLTDRYRETLEGLKGEHRRRWGDVEWEGE